MLRRLRFRRLVPVDLTSGRSTALAWGLRKRRAGLACGARESTSRSRRRRRDQATLGETRPRAGDARPAAALPPRPRRLAQRPAETAGNHALLTAPPAVG